MLSVIHFNCMIFTKIYSDFPLVLSPALTHTNSFIHTHTHTVGVISRCLHESILLDLLYEVMACVPGSLCMTVHHHREKESHHQR